MALPADSSAARIAALQTLLDTASVQEEAVDARAGLAWELRMIDPPRSRRLAEEAIALARQRRFARRPYARGMAAALAAQGFVETYAGDFATGVSRCLGALTLLEYEPASPVRVRAWFTLAWNSFFLSDYPAAMENGLKALHLAREIGDSLHEAWTLDALASFHGVTGDVVQALPLHEEALRLFRQLDELMGTLRALNNLAVSLHQVGRFEEAVEAGTESVRLAERYGIAMDISNNASTVAHVLIDMGRLDEADAYLRRALSGSASTAQVYALQYRSRICTLRQQPAEAEQCLLRGLELAERLEQRGEVAQCHRALADLYEERGDPGRALAHFKRFHALNETIAGERAGSRLDVLRITYQLEAAQHRAESFRRQTAELETRVEEQRRVQEELEQQSRLDSLTGLLNRRALDAGLAAEVTRHARSGAPLSIVMADVDHFKAYNDTYGHLPGDECLRRVGEVLRAVARRPADLVARYGGEEFVCVLPETDHAGALRVAEELRLAVIALGIPHARSDAGDHVTASLGVLTTRCDPAASPGRLLQLADEQLYAAKSAGRNRIAAINDAA